MKTTVDAFLGSYTVRQEGHGTHEADPIKKGNLVEITRNAGAPSTPTSAWVAFYDPSKPPPHGPPVRDLLFTLLPDGSLQAGDSGKVYRIALYQDNGSYKALYGLIVTGDPDQVGAWGADNNPS